MSLWILWDKMCILPLFSFIVLIDNVHFQICWLNRIHSTRIIDMGWLGKHNKGRRGWSSISWNEKRNCLYGGRKIQKGCWQITGLSSNLQNEEEENLVCAFFKHFLIFLCASQMLGARVTKLPSVLKTFTYLGTVLVFNCYL